MKYYNKCRKNTQQKQLSQNVRERLCQFNTGVNLRKTSHPLSLSRLVGKKSVGQKKSEVMRLERGRSPHYHALQWNVRFAYISTIYTTAISGPSCICIWADWTKIDRAPRTLLPFSF